MADQALDPALQGHGRGEAARAGAVHREVKVTVFIAFEDDVAAVTLRVPRAIVNDIDSERIARTVKVPRNTWILEALVEKLRRERKNGQTQDRHGTK